MVDKLKHPAKKSWISKFITSAWLTGTMLLFLLKPAVGKSNEQLESELLDALNPTPVAWNMPEVQATDNSNIDDQAFNQAQNGLTWAPPDITTIKNFFLNGGFLNPTEIQDFNTMRAESINSPSRPATYLTICDIRKTATNDYRKAIFITTLLDPFQKTGLGKSAFQAIDNDAGLKWTYKLCCKTHLGNIETIKLQKQNELAKKNNELAKKNLEEAKEVLKLLQQIEEVYIKYLNK